MLKKPFDTLYSLLLDTWDSKKRLELLHKLAELGSVTELRALLRYLINSDEIDLLISLICYKAVSEDFSTLRDIYFNQFPLGTNPKNILLETLGKIGKIDELTSLHQVMVLW